MLISAHSRPAHGGRGWKEIRITGTAEGSRVVRDGSGGRAEPAV